MPVNKAINEAVDAHVFVDFVGVGKAIDEAAASAQMMANKAINEAAVSAQMMANRLSTRCCAASATGGTQQSNRDDGSERHWRTGGVVT
jgi:hypothetical protein